MKQTFYFNTGVRPESVSNFPYEYHRNVGNIIRGTLLIPFDCDNVPDGSTFAFACDDPSLEPEAGYIVREITGGNIISKYAYFNSPRKL